MFFLLILKDLILKYFIISHNFVIINTIQFFIMKNYEESEGIRFLILYASNL